MTYIERKRENKKIWTKKKQKWKREKIKERQTPNNKTHLVAKGLYVFCCMNQMAELTGKCQCRCVWVCVFRSVFGWEWFCPFCKWFSASSLPNGVLSVYCSVSAHLHDMSLYFNALMYACTWHVQLHTQWKCILTMLKSTLSSYCCRQEQYSGGGVFLRKWKRWTDTHTDKKRQI